jgi:hypothetical protein
MDQIQNTSRKVLSKQEGTEKAQKPSQSTIPLKDAVSIMQWLTLRGALHYMYCALDYRYIYRALKSMQLSPLLYRPRSVYSTV